MLNVGKMLEERDVQRGERQVWLELLELAIKKLGADDPEVRKAVLTTYSPPLETYEGGQFVRVRVGGSSDSPVDAMFPEGSLMLMPDQAEQYKAFQEILRLHKGGLRFTIGFTHSNGVSPLFCPRVFSTDGPCARDLLGVLAILKKAVEEEIERKSSYADEIASLQKILEGK